MPDRHKYSFDEKHAGHQATHVDHPCTPQAAILSTLPSDVLCLQKLQTPCLDLYLAPSLIFFVHCESVPAGGLHQKPSVSCILFEICQEVSRLRPNSIDVSKNIDIYGNIDHCS